jgi:Uncharacterized conserved protein
MEKVFVLGSGNRIELDALRTAMAKVGLGKCEMWGCVEPVSGHKHPANGVEVLSLAVHRAKFAKRKYPGAIAVGIAGGTIKRSAGKGEFKFFEITEVVVIGEDGRPVRSNLKKTELVGEKIKQADFLSEAIVSVFNSIGIKA